MGKWAARLAKKAAAPPSAGTAITDKRGVLSVLTVTPEGGAREIQSSPAAVREPEFSVASDARAPEAEPGRGAKVPQYARARAGPGSVELSDAANATRCAHAREAEPSDGDALASAARRTRLLRWGWSEADAATLVERLAKRDRDADVRVSCADCRHYRPGRCGNHQAATLCTAEVGRDFAGMLQHCPGFNATGAGA